MQIAIRMQQAGFDIRGVRPPTVPEGTARLRLSLTLNAGVNDVEALIEQMSEVLG
jgi:8-amino-7-oxononanoate synthase